MNVKFQNVSRGVAIHHGRADDPDGGGVYTNPNLTGVIIHGVAPDSIGEMPDGPGARHFEGQKLIRVLSRDATPSRSDDAEKVITLEEKLARAISEIARLETNARAMAGGGGAELEHLRKELADSQSMLASVTAPSVASKTKTARAE